MKKRIKNSVVLICICLFFIACAGSGDDKTTETKIKDSSIVSQNQQSTFIYNVIPDDPSASISPQYTIASNTFSVEVLNEVYSDFEGQNLILSPFCLSRNLSIIAEGTTGDSKQELLNILGGQSAIDDAKNALSELLYADDSVMLQFADALWFDSRAYTLQTGFRDLIVLHYGVEISGLDFGDQTLVADTINRWISTNTNGMIPSMVTDEQIIDTAAFITSAVYFKADWTSPFDVTRTTENTFYSPDGNIRIDMMTSDYLHHTYKNDTYENVKIYYGTNNTDFFYLDIYMPVAVSIKDFLENECLTALALQPEYTTGTLMMPGFEIETHVDLIPALKTLGVVGIFDATKGDITGIFNETNQVYLNSISQKSGIKADEEGTVAYSVTVSSVGESSASLPPDHNIVLNHPFVYFIRAGQNGLVLFAGVLNNPPI